MEIEIKTEDDEGNVVFEGTLKKRDLDFVISVGINFLLANGVSPFVKDREDTDDDTMIGPSTTTKQ